MNMDSVKEEIKTFVDSLVPGNYFLTKSMELSKVRNSGTLWYTKKFLVLYYYIFLYKNIEVRDTVVEICIIFDEYIASLPEKLRVNAEEFFYSGYPTANLKSPDFRLFDDFAGNAIFDSEKEKRDYAEFAKKYYFAFLMESGGQSGVKREIKEHLYKKEFCCRDLDNIIKGYCDRNGWGGNTLISIKNDYMAFLRNERQILFYYGFVHSKTNGSKDVEFSSLTPIGELALHSNYYELIAIWEHQKVKMLSQPVTVDINNIDSKVEYGTEYFKVNTDPYLTILENMHKGDGFTFEQYQYVISRIEEHQDSQLLFDDDSMTMIREKVNSFERDADVTPEDFTKELKKYLLGIRDDLKMDKGCNPLGLCTLARHNEVKVNNKDLLSRMVMLYSIIRDYKQENYSQLFNDCCMELRKQYGCKNREIEYTIDTEVKMKWDMYNIHTELPILLSVMVLVSEQRLGMLIAPSNISSFVDEMLGTFRSVLKGIGLATKSGLRKELSTLYKAIEEKSFMVYTQRKAINNETADLHVTAYVEKSIEDLRRKIDDLSNLPSHYEDGVRKRNLQLISLVRSYNAKLLTNKPLTCECCGEPTFVTKNNDYYVEYHHLIPFSEYDGADHLYNLFVLCPMCHRKIHYMKASDKEALYNNISQNNYLHKTLSDRLIALKQARKLKSYQLEFLLTEKAITVDVYNQVESA